MAQPGGRHSRSNLRREEAPDPLTLRSAFLDPTAFPPTRIQSQSATLHESERQPITSWVLGLGPPEAPRTNGRLGLGGPIRGSVRRAEVAVGRAEAVEPFFFGRGAESGSGGGAHHGKALGLGRPGAHWKDPGDRQPADSQAGGWTKPAT